MRNLSWGTYTINPVLLGPSEVTMFNAALNAARRIHSELAPDLVVFGNVTGKADGSRANPSPISPRAGSSHGILGMFILVQYNIIIIANINMV